MWRWTALWTVWAIFKKGNEIARGMCWGERRNLSGCIYAGIKFLRKNILKSTPKTIAFKIV